MVMHNHSGTQKRLARGKRICFLVLAICVGTIFALIAAEIILRIVPIPGIQFDIAKYDPVAGGGYYPNSTVIYRNEQGDHVRRKINRWGYADKDHDREKQEGIYRIGFFGDSFTHAVQVPLDQTFFRLIEKRLQGHRIECLAFGVCGYSTLQSYLNWKRWADFFDIDMAVYVFCENDLGDQMKDINKSGTVPYAVLSEGGFTIDNSFRESRKNRQRFYYKVGDFLTAHSLVAATISQRLKLLFRHGIKTRVTEEDRAMAALPNDPSVWSDSLKEYAKKLGEAVISKWRDEVKKRGKTFVVAYAPNSLEVDETDASGRWKPWLKEFCQSNHILFVDPCADFIRMNRRGFEVFFDHFTKYGHVAFSDSFARWFEDNSSGWGR